MLSDGHFTSEVSMSFEMIGTNCVQEKEKEPRMFEDLIFQS